MEASPAKVIQYFNGEKQNLIPLFQRPYSWTQNNWQTLWDDVMVQYESDNKSSHFMGAIVSVPAKSVPVGVSKFLIIDGQQRLTTISILLCALRDSVDENNASRIQEVYLTNKYRETQDTLKFVPTQANREEYTAIALKSGSFEGSSNLIKAYQFFKNKLSSDIDSNGDKVEPTKVLVTLEHTLQVVMINLGDTDDPYLIFESLNFKGEPLTQADLVRNYLLMQFRHSMSDGGEQERIFKEYWLPLENQMGSDLTGFLRFYGMRFGDNVSLGSIYTATKARLKDMGTSDLVEAELKTMQRFGSHYATILHPELEGRIKIRSRLVNLKSLDVTTSYPLLLRLFDANATGLLNDFDFEKCLGLVEAFVIRRAVCGVPTNNLNKLFLQWSKFFPGLDHVSWLHVSMSSGNGGRRFPTDLEFSEAYRMQPQYGRGSTRFILLRLEQSYNHKEPVDLSACTIEHILPQTLTPAWLQELGEGGKDVHDKMLHTIGNLTLTGYNAELGNMAFAEKKGQLENTHIELNKLILKQNRWTYDEIMLRANVLLERAQQIWIGPVDYAIGKTALEGLVQ